MRAPRSVSPTKFTALLAGPALALALTGCTDASKPETGSKTASNVAAEAPPASPAARSDLPAGPGGTAAGAGARARAAAAEDPRMQQAHALERRQDYDRQMPVSLPAGMPAPAAKLLPTADAKLVEVELHRAMVKLAPTPGRAHLAVRWITLKRGKALTAMIGQQLVAAGWLKGEPPTDAAAVAGPFEHPEWGTLTVKRLEPDRRPSRISFAIAGPDQRRPMPSTAELFGRSPLWLPALGGARLAGFEFGRYHSAGASYSDLERFAGRYAVEDAKAVEMALHRSLVARGWRIDEDDPRLLRAPGAVSSTFTTRLGADGVLAVHHQRRYQRTAKPAQAPADDR